MKFLYELFLYLVDRLDDLCYEIDEWKRESSDTDKYLAIVGIGFIVGILFLGGCALPDRAHKLTIIGAGVLPPGVTGVPFPLPFFGYWNSEHESSRPVPSVPPTGQASTTSILDVPAFTPYTLEDFMCVPDTTNKVLHCGTYESWDAWEREQMKKHGF